MRKNECLRMNCSAESNSFRLFTSMNFLPCHCLCQCGSSYHSWPIFLSRLTSRADVVLTVAYSNLLFPTAFFLIIPINNNRISTYIRAWKWSMCREKTDIWISQLTLMKILYYASENGPFESFLWAIVANYTTHTYIYIVYVRCSFINERWEGKNKIK